MRFLSFLDWLKNQLLFRTDIACIVDFSAVFEKCYSEKGVFADTGIYSSGQFADAGLQETFSTANISGTYSSQSGLRQLFFSDILWIPKVSGVTYDSYMLFPRGVIFQENSLYYLNNSLLCIT